MSADEHASDHQLTMAGKTCLVTGTTSGVGRETALGLARMGGTVLMVARDARRGEAAAAEVRRLAPHGTAVPFVADLALQRDVRALAADVTSRYERLDVLVHNAAAVNAARRITVEGVEATLALNHLAPFLLTHLLHDALCSAAAARVVTVSSYMHTRVKALPWDDLQGDRAYRGQDAYNLSKLMNILFTYELARRHSGGTVTANCLHPGWPLKTNLGREQHGMGGVLDRATKLFGASAAKGARTPLYVASSPSVAGVSGTYFSRNAPAKSSALSHDTAAGVRLWEVSSQLCGLAATTAEQRLVL